MDGLSLDCHRLFTKKLSTIKTSFSANYEQAKVFETAFEQIIKVNGQLHTVFHMIQSVFTLFETLIKWAITIVEWKKIQITKVSHNFRLYRRLAFLLQDELNRYMWDVFISENTNMLQSLINEYKDDTATLMVAVTKTYLSWIKDKSKQTMDEHHKKYSQLFACHENISSILVFNTCWR